MDIYSKETDHPADMIVMQLSKKSIESLENNYIIHDASKKEPIVEVSHIDFIFGDQQWIVKNCGQLIQGQQ